MIGSALLFRIGLITLNLVLFYRIGCLLYDTRFLVEAALDFRLDQSLVALGGLSSGSQVGLAVVRLASIVLGVEIEQPF